MAQLCIILQLSFLYVLHCSDVRLSCHIKRVLLLLLLCPPLIGGGIKRCFCLTSVGVHREYSWRPQLLEARRAGRRSVRRVWVGAGSQRVACTGAGSYSGGLPPIACYYYWAFTRSDRLTDRSVRLVGPTIVSCKRFVGQRVGQTVGCLISSDCRSDCRSVWTLRPTGRTDRPVADDQSRCSV